MATNILQELVDEGHADDAEKIVLFLLDKFDPYNLPPQLVEDVLAFEPSNVN